MSWFFNLIGRSSGNVAEVTADNELEVALSSTSPGPVKLLDGKGEMLRVTDTGALLTSQREAVFMEQVDGNALNTNRWTVSASGMTVAQSAGFITVNSGAATTSSSYAILQSIRSIPLYGALPVMISMNVKTTVTAQLNATMELGIGAVATTAAPTDGCYFRWNVAGEFRAIVNSGGVETSSSAIAMPPINNSTLFEIEIVEDEVAFIVDDVEVAVITVPVALAYPTSSGRLPIFMRVYTASSTPVSAPVLSLGQLTVVQQDVVQRRNWEVVMAAMGNGGYQSPVTTFTQTANNTNSAAPSTIAAGSLSNTTAAYSTFGGKFAFAAVAGAATDFILFAFQVPAGYQLYVRGVAISVAVTGANLATGTVFDWSLGANGSAVSLATADSPPTTWAPRRVAVGLQGFAGTAVIGQAADLARSFWIPVVVDGGRYLHVILAIPSGAQTGSVVFRGSVMIDGYFE